MISHLLRYQGLAVDDYGFVLDALDLGHPKFAQLGYKKANRGVDNHEDIYYRRIRFCRHPFDT
jgi:hypothetical protein